MAGWRGLVACIAGGAGATSACGAQPASPPGFPGGEAAADWAHSPLLAAGATGSDVGLTLYSDGWGLVSDARPVTLVAGAQVARFEGVATTTDPRGALFEAPGTVAGVRFRNDAANRERLLDRFDGQRVEVFSAEASQTLAGILRMTPAGPLFQVGDRLYTEPPGTVILPGHGALAVRPALDFLVRAGHAWSGTATASYLAGQLGWSCEYTLTTDVRQGAGHLSQWAAMSNGSGLTYRDASVTLVAGATRRGGGFPPPMPMRTMAPGMAGAEAADVAPERFAVRYLFRLPQRMTLERDDQARVLLSGERAVPITRTFRLEEGVAPFRHPDPDLPAKARVRLTLENTEAGGLGIPLPAGRVTVYTPDARGRRQLAGESAIPDTPVDQRILLDMGEAFDVTARRTQTSFTEYPDAKEIGYRSQLRNQTDAAVTVEVYENIPGDWRLLAAS
ncbi:MAG: DUF4139 domain-containing protein [Candidatus Sericytochromatia bacterium]|nr:DUF4139 domain-containing protein [Candidatus Tanganyikabacteria bacterium]